MNLDYKYKRIPVKIRNILKINCFAMVSHEFACMANPKHHCGKNFWENFPERMACRGSCRVVLIPKKYEKVASKFMEEFSKSFATSLCEAFDWGK